MIRIKSFLYFWVKNMLIKIIPLKNNELASLLYTECIDKWFNSTLFNYNKNFKNPHNSSYFW